MTFPNPTQRCLLAASVLAVALVACDGDVGRDSHRSDGGPVLVDRDAAVGALDAVTTDDRTWPDRDSQPAWSDEYGGRLLGVTLYGESLVEFSLFAPAAVSVSVVGEWGEEPMVRGSSGVWTVLSTIHEPIGKRYRYRIDGNRLVADPYSKANRQHRGDSLIVDTEFAWSDNAWQRPRRSELVIYEMHLSDFTHDASSGVAPGTGGRYAGFIQRIDYLQRLGVNAVQLMPISESQADDYGWGYDPALLFAPEAGYASSIDGAQVPEFQAVVDALHAAGIAVIIDVVYNHVSGQGADNVFHSIDSVYYFDFDGDGHIDDDVTAWGYKLATQRPMVRKLIYDNMKYWMDTFHVDGFRLDSTENMHFDSVVDAVRALDSEGYGDRYFVLEEFSGRHNSEVQWTNRDVGRSLLTSWGTGYKSAIWSALADGRCECTSLGVPTFFSRDNGWSAADEVVNYYTSHDEGTLVARHGSDAAGVRLAATHLLTSLGIPMLWMGEEFMRTHYGNYHPQGNVAAMARENNVVKWALVDQNSAVVDFMAAMIRLRVAHPALRSTDGRHLEWNTVGWDGAIGYRFIGTPGDNDFIVLVNYSNAPAIYPVQLAGDGQWYVMSDGTRATSEAPGVQQRAMTAGTNMVDVPARTAVVLMSSVTN